MDISNLSAAGSARVQPSAPLPPVTPPSRDLSSNPISSALAGDSMSISSQAKAAAQNPGKTDFDQLGKLINSGDMDDAKSYLQKIQDKAKQAGSDGPDYSGLQSALDSGNVSAAQSSWSAMSQDLQGGSGGAPSLAGPKLDAGLLAAYLNHPGADASGAIAASLAGSDAMA